MNFLSCFSGIEAASAAFIPLGWNCIGVAEVKPFPCAVLALHYPDVLNLGDVLADDFLERVEMLQPDVLVGGPPCQDFSIAGLRAGINGDRGNLTLRWVQIIHASHARFAVTENVPGWLSANNGHAFGAFLSGLVGHDTALLPPRNCGGKWTDAGMVAGPDGRACWRILDAQFFGLAQRRKRVFVVFCPGDRDDPATILLEPKSLRRHPAPRREKGQGIANALTERPDRGGGNSEGQRLIARSLCGQAQSSHREDSDNFLVANPLGARRGGGWRGDLDNDTYVARCLNAHGGSGRSDGTHALRADGFDASEDGTGRGTPLVAAFPLDRENGKGSGGNIGWGSDGDPCFTMQTTHAHAVATMSAVRRLTPVECARLQGFPETYLDITFRGRPAADGNKYRALGNSMAVPVMQWIGKRIEAAS